MILSKSLLMTLKRLMTRYCDGVKDSAALLHTGHILYIFHGLAKPFFLSWGNSGKGWCFSSNLDLEANFIAKSLTLSDEG